MEWRRGEDQVSSIHISLPPDYRHEIHTDITDPPALKLWVRIYPSSTKSFRQIFSVIILVKVTHTQKQGGMLILQRVLQFNQFYWRKQWFRGKDFPKNVGSNISEDIEDIVTHIQEEDALYLWHI